MEVIGLKKLFLFGCSKESILKQGCVDEFGGLLVKFVIVNIVQFIKLMRGQYCWVWFKC